MINESPAQLLAAVLRVVAPGEEITLAPPHCVMVGLTTRSVGGPSPYYRADSRDSLARVVAMLTPEQCHLFDAYLPRILDKAPLVMPSEAYKATPAQILAALVAATQVQA